jgi:hypothetical protein
MPLPASNSSLTKSSSVNRLLPPSITRSPGESRSPSLATVELVGRTVGDHHPDQPRGLEGLHEGLKRRDIGDVGVEVEADDLVPGTANALAHVAAHFAQPDQTDLHAAS